MKQLLREERPSTVWTRSIWQTTRQESGPTAT